MVADNLRQIELGVELRRGQVIDLALGIRVRVGPAPERQAALMLAEHLPELPGMFDRAGRPDRLVAPEHDQRRESVLVRALRVRETVLDRVLGREKGDDPFARNVSTEVRHEMAEIVFFLRTDRAVGQEHECTLTAQAAYGVVGVDPCVHALARCQFGPRRPQLRCNDGGTGSEGCEEIHSWNCVLYTSAPDSRRQHTRCRIMFSSLLVMSCPGAGCQCGRAKLRSTRVAVRTG